MDFLQNVFMCLEVPPPPLYIYSKFDVGLHKTKIKNIYSQTDVMILIKLCYNVPSLDPNKTYWPLYP